MPLKVSDGMGAWISDFQKSNAPQFKGKSEKERRDQAISAYMAAKKEGVNESDASWAAAKEKEKMDRLTPGDQDKISKIRAMLDREKARKAHQANKASDNKIVKGHKFAYPKPTKESIEEETNFEVSVEGLPKIYMKGKSPGAIKAELRKLLRQQKTILDVQRITPAELKGVFRLKAQGKGEQEGGAEMEEATQQDKKPPFEGPYRKVDGPRKDKFGNVIKTKNIAKHLAKQGMAQQTNKEETELDEKKKLPGLWANIHAKRKRGERPARPGEKGYPKTLDIESKEEVKEGSGSLKPGWMLKADPKLSAAVKAKQDLAKKRQASYGKPEAGKSVKEEAEIEEGLQQKLRKYVPGYAKRQIDKKMDAEKFGKRDVDRDANYWRYKKVQDKLKKEEVEQVDEISKATKLSYYMKATTTGKRRPQDLEKQSKADAQRMKDDPENPVWKKRKAHWDNKIAKRHQGIDKAKAALTKEEVNEISGELAQRYHDKAVKAPRKADAKDPIGHVLKRFSGMQRAQDRIHTSELKRISDKHSGK